jgi:hypothetical protein
MDRQNKANRPLLQNEKMSDDKLILSEDEMKKILGLFSIFIEIDRKGIREKNEKKN